MQVGEKCSTHAATALVFLCALAGCDGAVTCQSGVSAAALAADYAENAVAANDRWRGSAVAVHGAIADIGDADGIPYVQFLGPSGRSVRAKFRPGEASRATVGKLTKGQSASVCGRVVGQDGLQVLLEDAAATDGDPPPDIPTERARRALLRVADSLKIPNDLGVSSDDLVTQDDGSSEGLFVYVARMKFPDGHRPIGWFVFRSPPQEGGNDACPITNTARELTPGLWCPWSIAREVGVPRYFYGSD